MYACFLLRRPVAPCMDEENLSEKKIPVALPFYPTSQNNIFILPETLLRPEEKWLVGDDDHGVSE